MFLPAVLLPVRSAASALQAHSLRTSGDGHRGQPERGARMRRKLATLTIAENKRWEWLFSWAVNNGYTQRAADKEAWKGLCEEFPRLRKFDGARA
jgi:hypothetical protein